MSWRVVIPFRDRGTDPLRRQNLDAVVKHWEHIHDTTPVVFSDGRTGSEQFNRSAAYNDATRSLSDADGYVFAESDMLISPHQVENAIELAQESPGLVVPFTEYRYLGAESSAKVREGVQPGAFIPRWTMPDGRSIGAINVVSRMTMGMVGQWDETFEGNWYDDDAMKIAFEACAGPTRWVDGPAFHLYHLPGHRGDHLTPEDKAATAHNKSRLAMYRHLAMGPNAQDAIRKLTRGAR